MNLEILKVQQNRNNLKCSTKQFFLIVDSQLAKESNIGVQEMVNGCMCCVLVGQMKLALQELKGKKKMTFWLQKCLVQQFIFCSLTDKYNPDRIIIETSGSAFPGTKKKK